MKDYEHIKKLMNRIDGHNPKIRLCPYFYLSFAQSYQIPYYFGVII